MLDDLKYIHERDAQDALGIAEKQWQQYQNNYAFNWQPQSAVTQVIVAGMGGSGLAATAAKSWPGLNVPFVGIHDYELPASVNNTTLLICSSYSGNTEETLACLEKALQSPIEQRPMIVIIAAGGKLIETAKQNQLPFVELPTGYQPRMTFGYQLRALLEVLVQARLAPSERIDELNQAAQKLQQGISEWLPDKPAKSNSAKSLALELMGKSPVIYSGPKLFPAAYKWKINFNENAKNVAWCNQLPEFNHNEFLGWTSHPVDKPYAVIDLRSNMENPRIQKRFEITEKLLSGRRPAPHVVNAVGANLIEQLLWVVAFGDFVSLYLALLNGLNPTPVDLIEKLKQALNS